MGIIYMSTVSLSLHRVWPFASGAAWRLSPLPSVGRQVPCLQCGPTQVEWVSSWSLSAKFAVGLRSCLTSTLTTRNRSRIESPAIRSTAPTHSVLIEPFMDAASTFRLHYSVTLPVFGPIRSSHAFLRLDSIAAIARAAIFTILDS